MRYAILPAAVLLALALAAFAEEPPKKVTEEEAKARCEALMSAMLGSDAAAKACAMGECARAPHPLTATALGALLSEPDDQTRIDAANALGLMAGFPDAACALHEALPANESRPAVLRAIFAAMESVGMAWSIPISANWALARLENQDEAVVESVNLAINCLGSLRFKESVERLIEIQVHAEATVIPGPHGIAVPVPDVRALKALTRLTGQKFSSANDWATWWKEVAPTVNDDLTPKMPKALKEPGVPETPVDPTKPDMPKDPEQPTSVKPG